MKLETELQKLVKEKTKLRFLKNFSQEKYIEDLKFTESIQMLKIRLNMVETKGNYKGMFKNTELTCELCKTTDDTTEHLLECKITGRDITTNVDDIRECNKKIVEEITRVIKDREELGYKIRIGETDDDDK